ncbi:MAG: hypothetical protein V4700_05665 [Pseudomonadota bacterium]
MKTKAREAQLKEEIEMKMKEQEKKINELRKGCDLLQATNAKLPEAAVHNA